MKLIVFLMSLLAVSGVVATFGREYNAAFWARSSEARAFEILASRSEVPELPFSNRSMREVFETCARVQQSLIQAFQPPETQRAVDESCAALARDALIKNPTYSAAHTILMLSTADAAQGAQALIQSQKTAPRESWNAKLRLREGLSLQSATSPALDAALESDVNFMVQTPAGRNWLARLYHADPASRAMLVRVIDQRPNAEKASFLREVRALGQD
ncbi:hypothetical protein [Pseudorhodobacter sp. MZDSW-24AT]|uniref:hypothetical protein n=1 Tax=Pseudorhodobacter sp. MZDSW-24AT TaxID=2052957 RepID=UPI000C1F24FB|nr:hypothetical protein [Pseudorhodobacter sp. MZDSW-24AT]PJF10620.1 hypothetical protein CUR21_04605 [Pseudorhodobacter sp. MZDSW-24AT]